MPTSNINIIQDSTGKWFICDKDIAPDGFDTSDEAINFCKDWSNDPDKLQITIDTGQKRLPDSYVCMTHPCKHRYNPTRKSKPKSFF